MWKTTLWCVLALFLSITVLSGVCDSEPGGPCNEDTIPGDCVPISQCRQIIMDIQQNKTALQNVLCRRIDSNPLYFVCCPNGKTPRPMMSTAPTIINRVKEVPQNSRISVRKCYEYAKLVYTKQQSVALIDQYVDIDHCVKLAEGLIVNGEAAKMGEFPHMALLGYGEDKANLKYHCGGSLVSERYVLTAAHCASIAVPTNVLLGEFVIADETDGAKTQLIPVADFIPHPKYASTAHYFDIALIRLSTEVVLNPLLRPACLHSDQTYDSTSLTATGWGRLDFYDNEQSNILMKVTLSEFNDTKCNKTHVDYVKLAKGVLPEQQMCVGSLLGKDTCQGDSGGPLQEFLTEPHCSYLVVGVTSFGKGCGLHNTPGVYSRVKYFIQWIEDIVWPPDANNSTVDNNTAVINSTTEDSGATTTISTIFNNKIVNHTIANIHISNNSAEYREHIQMLAVTNGSNLQTCITTITNRLMQICIVFYLYHLKYV